MVSPELENPNPLWSGSGQLKLDPNARPQNLSAQFVCPSPKVQDFNEKRLHWASVVRDGVHKLSRWWMAERSRWLHSCCRKDSAILHWDAVM